MIGYQLLKELISEENDCYRQLIGSDKRFKEVLQALAGDGIGPAPTDK